MLRARPLFAAVATLAAGSALVLPAAAAAAGAVPTNVDVSQRHLNESEEAIAVNPTNPNNIVTVTNVVTVRPGSPRGCWRGSASTADTRGRPS